MNDLAHICSRLSRLAYDDNPDLGEVGQTLFTQFDCGGTQAFISIDDEDHMFLVFRGTEELSDIKADMRYVKVNFPNGGRAHLGFHTAFRKVEDVIAAKLKIHRGRTWIFTGHSLGAALALLAAARWKPAVVYLYGCPRVGNSAFVKTIKCPVWRFENRRDFVTCLPPPTSPLQIWHSLRHGRRPTFYRQAGKRVRLSGLGHGSKSYVDATAGV